MSKNFTMSSTELFLNNGIEKAPKENNDINNVSIPRGYKIVPESRNVKTLLLTKKSTKESIKKIALDKNISVNELLNVIIEEYISRSDNL